MKQNLKKILFFLPLLMPLVVLAEKCADGATDKVLGICPEDYPELPSATWNITVVVSSIAEWFAVIGGTASVAGIIYAGIRYIVAGGDPEKIKSAKVVFKYALIGGVLIILSWGIVSFIENVIIGGGIPAPEL